MVPSGVTTCFTAADSLSLLHRQTHDIKEQALKSSPWCVAFFESYLILRSSYLLTFLLFLMLLFNANGWNQAVRGVCRRSVGFRQTRNVSSRADRGAAGGALEARGNRDGGGAGTRLAQGLSVALGKVVYFVADICQGCWSRGSSAIGLRGKLGLMCCWLRRECCYSSETSF